MLQTCSKWADFAVTFDCNRRSETWYEHLCDNISWCTTVFPSLVWFIWTNTRKTYCVYIVSFSSALLPILSDFLQTNQEESHGLTLIDWLSGHFNDCHPASSALQWMETKFQWLTADQTALYFSFSGGGATQIFILKYEILHYQFTPKTLHSSSYP